MSTRHTIYLQEVICKDNITKENVVHSDNWSPSIFDHCPRHDSNHTFRISIIITSVSDNIITLTSDATNTRGRYRNQDVIFDVPAGPSTGYPIASTKSFPYNTRFVSYEFTPKPENIGDSLSIYVAPSAPVGTLTQNVSNGNVLRVSNSIITKIEIGMEVLLDDGVNTQNLGECLSIDVQNQTITVEEPVAFSFSSGTFVTPRFCIAKNHDIPNTNVIKLGGRVPGNRFINTNLSIVLCYNNTTAVPKTVHIRTEMFV